MHFLRKSELERLDRVLGRLHAAVRVRVEETRVNGTRLVIAPDGEDHAIVVCKMDVLFVPLPERIKLVGPDGKVVKPSKASRFWVTVETFDPLHLVVEAKDLPLR